MSPVKQEKPYQQVKITPAWFQETKQEKYSSRICTAKDQPSRRNSLSHLGQDLNLYQKSSRESTETRHKPASFTISYFLHPQNLNSHTCQRRNPLKQKKQKYNQTLKLCELHHHSDKETRVTQNHPSSNAPHQNQSKTDPCTQRQTITKQGFPSLHPAKTRPAPLRHSSGSNSNFAYRTAEP